MGRGVVESRLDSVDWSQWAEGSGAVRGRNPGAYRGCRRSHQARERAAGAGASGHE